MGTQKPGGHTMNQTNIKQLEVLVRAADEKQAKDIMVLDMRGLSLLADYFVIMHGTSERQVGAIMKGILDTASKNEIKVKQMEGQEGGTWILVDTGDVILHIFEEEMRSFYNLEKLWSDAPLVDTSEWISE